MTNSKLDSRQTKNRAPLDQIVNGVNTELDDQLSSINAELTMPFRMKRDSTYDVGSQRTITIERIMITNPVHGRNHTLRPINNKIPNFTATGTITVDKTLQTLSMSPGFPSTLVIPAPIANGYLKVLIQVSTLNSGTIVASVGTWNTDRAAASFPTIVRDAYIVGYIVLSTNAGSVIQDPLDLDVYQFVGQDVFDQQYGVDIILDTSNFSNIVLPNSSSANTVQKAFDYIDDNVVAKSASATDNAIVRFDSTTGQVIQNSGATVEDSGHVGTPGVDVSIGTEPNLISGKVQFFAQAEGTHAPYIRNRMYMKDSDGRKLQLGYGAIPIGGIIATMPHLTGAYNCIATTIPDDTGFVLCQGQTITDQDSPMYNTVIPDLRNSVFLMGNNVSGTTPGITAGGSNTLQNHTHSGTNSQLTDYNASHDHSMKDHRHPIAAYNTGGATAAIGGTCSGSVSITSQGVSGGSISVAIADHPQHNHIWTANNVNTAMETYDSAGGMNIVWTTVPLSPFYVASPGNPPVNPAWDVYFPWRTDLIPHNAYTSMQPAWGHTVTTASFNSGANSGISASFNPGAISVNDHAHSIPPVSPGAPANINNTDSKLGTISLEHSHTVNATVSVVDNRPNYFSVVYLMRVR